MRNDTPCQDARHGSGLSGHACAQTDDEGKKPSLQEQKLRIFLKIVRTSLSSREVVFQFTPRRGEIERMRILAAQYMQRISASILQEVRIEVTEQTGDDESAQAELSQAEDRIGKAAQTLSEKLFQKIRGTVQVSLASNGHPGGYLVSARMQLCEYRELVSILQDPRRFSDDTSLVRIVPVKRNKSESKTILWKKVPFKVKGTVSSTT